MFLAVQPPYFLVSAEAPIKATEFGLNRKSRFPISILLYLQGDIRTDSLTGPTPDTFFTIGPDKIVAHFIELLAEGQRGFWTEMNAQTTSFAPGLVDC
jgi:hypothetical protein